MLFDTHAHLDRLEDFASEVERAHSVGVNKILMPSCDLASAEWVCQHADATQGLYAAVGVHPGDAGEEMDWEHFETLLSTATAMGEVGLDFYWEKDLNKRAEQARVLRVQLALAQKYTKPVIVHAREAECETLEILREFDLPKVVFHCFAGQELAAIVERGWYVSFTGNITYPKAEIIRASVQAVPQGQYFLETDCPFLAPQSVRGKSNEPSYLPEIAAKVAEVRGEEVGEVAEYTTENACGFFGV